MTSIRFYRSDDGAIAGVCKGLGEAFDVEPAVLRIGFILLALIGGSGFITYLALIFALPRKDKLSSAMEAKVLGVCALLAQRFDIEVGIIRFLAIFSAAASFGITIIGYIALYFLMPETSKNVRDIN